MCIPELLFPWNSSDASSTTDFFYFSGEDSKTIDLGVCSLFVSSSSEKRLIISYSLSFFFAAAACRFAWIGLGIGAAAIKLAFTLLCLLEGGSASDW